MLRSSVLIGMLGIPLTACGGGPTGPEPAAPAAVPVTNPTAKQRAAPGAPTAGIRAKFDLAAMVEAALAAAAEKTGLARSDLAVASSEAVVWADGSIGCAEPGMNYTMAPVAGYRIIIEARGERLDYHATERGYLILCPPGRSTGTALQETM
jgi:hypothetical protein